MEHRVMVVDDDTDLRETLCELLTEEGYVAFGMPNGLAALEYLRSNEAPCMVFLDLMMPVMDGLEFLEQRQRDERLVSIPVVVITASGLAPRQGVSAQRVLPKPLRLEKVVEAVQEFC